MWKQLVCSLLVICVLFSLLPMVTLKADAAADPAICHETLVESENNVQKIEDRSEPKTFANDLVEDLKDNLAEHAETGNAITGKNQEVQPISGETSELREQAAEINPEQINAYHTKTIRKTSGEPYADVLLLMAVEEAILEAILKGEDSVDITEYQIGKDNTLLALLNNYSPYLSNGIDVTAWYRGNQYVKISIENKMSTEETKEYFTQVNQKLEYIKLLVQKGASDLDKALILHDYMVHAYEYDESYSFYGSGDMLMKGTGVCNAYACLYMYIMNHVGIECYVTSSDDMYHGWNIIRIGDEYYHVDVTWDDPIPDSLGRVRHGHFLVSDSAIQTQRNNSTQTHYGWDRTDLVCDDNSYDEAYWTDITSQIIHCGENQYYIKGGSIVRRNLQTATEATIKEFGKWYVWDNPNSYYPPKYSGLFELGGYLYYNTPTTINKISLGDGQESVVFTPETSNGYVYGCALRGNRIDYVIKQSPNDAGEILTVPQTVTIEAIGILLNETSIVLHQGESCLLTACLLPADADTQYVWESSRPEIATIDASGRVSAVSAGEAIVSAKLPNGISAQCAVKVCRGYTYVADTVPTVSKEGSIKGVCDDCGRETKIVLPKLNATDYTYSLIKPATCTETGAERYTWKNTTYGTFIFDVVIAEISHDYANSVTAPTCTEGGYTIHTCTDCGDSYRDSETATLGHAWNEGSVTSASTCTAEGVKTYTCTRCGEEKTESISATGHNYTAAVTAPTCTEGGYTTHTCTDCGDSYRDSETATLSHAWNEGSVTSASTCTAEGVKTYTCTRCGEGKTESISATGHNYTAVVTAPTCTEGGYTTHTCTVCGDSYVDNYTDEVGHYYAARKTLKDGQSLVLTDFNTVKHNKSLIFSANADALGDGLIYLSHGKNVYSGSYIEITAEKLRVCTTLGTVTSAEYAHGLSIAGNVTVRIDVERLGAVVTITTDSGTFTQKVSWEGCNGEIACGVEGAELSNVRCRWYSLGIGSDYWFLGDSWFSTQSPARWTNYMLDDGYSDVLLAGYGGMGAQKGLQQFRQLLQFDAPQYAIWTLGMNDGDENGKINSSWLNATRQFLNLCEENGTTPILCTIPTTPNVDNRPKNAWIMNSGYQYIDFDLAVVESHVTGSWFEGMAEPDLNHPTELGALALYAQVFADFPELAKADPVTCNHSMHFLGDREAECEYAGRRAYYVCALCGGQYTDVEGTASTSAGEMRIAPLGHTYFYDITASTCTAEGLMTATCVNCGDTKTEAIPANGHSYDEGEMTTAPTCTEAGVLAYTCTTCGANVTEAIPANGHSYEETVTAPTCTEGGYTTYKCEDCGDRYVTDEVAALGHSYNEGEVTTAPTCTTEGVKTFACTRCGEEKTESISATGHNYTAAVTASTCTEGGYTIHTCTDCGDSYRDSETAALGHAWNGGNVTSAPTCTAEGVKTYTCTRCGEKKTESISATGHNYTAEVTAPTCVEGGYTTYTCSACGSNYISDNAPATGHNYSGGFCTNCGDEDPDWLPDNPFVDVKEADYFYTPVLWAVQKGITNGTSATKFSPEEPCTRGQIVTFLWRACGSPEPGTTNNPFRDVSSGAYYYKAVLWAVENGITTGVSANRFGPEETCTRGQVATFLWRAQGKPAPTSSNNPFKDVSRSDYYYEAVLWAAENNITQGTKPGKFSPNDSCTRGQIVTFLYRALA